MINSKLKGVADVAGRAGAPRGPLRPRPLRCLRDLMWNRSHRAKAQLCQKLFLRVSARWCVHVLALTCNGSQAPKNMCEVSWCAGEPDATPEP
jgi:hypothetical protein